MYTGARMVSPPLTASLALKDGLCKFGGFGNYTLLFCSMGCVLDPFPKWKHLMIDPSKLGVGQGCE